MTRLREVFGSPGRLARRLIIAVVLFSSLITLATTAIQLYLDYKHDLGQIQRDFDLIESSYLQSLINNVWVADRVQIQTLLNGLRSLPDMEFLSISVDGEIEWTAGTLESSRATSRRFPLVHRYQDKDVTIGELVAVASMDAVYGRLIDKAVIILVSNGVTIFLVAGFILVVFHFLVTRHLFKIAALAKHPSFPGASVPIALDRKQGQKEPDELDDVIAALKEMQSRTVADRDAIRGREARLRAILDAAVDAIITIDENGIIESISPSTKTLFGYAAAETIGKNVNMLMPEPYSGEHDRYIENYLSTREKKIIGIGREVVGQRKDGSIFPMHLSVSEAFVSGRRLFIGIVHDVSERKKSEAELRRVQKMDAIGQLTGGIAHDFNNLLTVITGNLEMLEPRISDENQRAMIEQAQEAVELGASLTGRLLAFARRQTLEPKPIDVNELVLGMTELLRRTLGETIRIGTVLESHLWRTRADPGQLENALLNLAINARDAMPGGGNLTIETANREFDSTHLEAPSEIAPGGYVVLSVTDSGVGMSDEVKERAIEPFFTTKEASAGTGLGLSMAYGFANQSGGHLALYSEVGHGTTVSLYLPEIAEDAATTTAAQKPDEEVRASGETVLVVEDDARVRRTSVLRLADLGYKVLEADSGEAALKIISDGYHVDLLFTDIVMPGGMDGPGLAQEAQRRLPSLKVLFTSGYAEAGAVGSNLLQEGAMLLRKPYKTSDLARKIRGALST